MSISKITFAPISYTGWGAMEKLKSELEKFSPEKILIVTDPVLLEIGIISRVRDSLEAAGFNYGIYSEVAPEPSLESGEKLVAYTRNHSFDLVIGIGGGSALDLAKLAAVIAPQNGMVADYLNLTGTKQIENKGLPKILIPTTSGTGSEVTNIAVLSLETTKDVVTHDYLLADIAIIDPELTLTVPKRVTAATGIDALTHAIEAYVSNHASRVTDGLALQAIRLISQSLRTAVYNGKNKQARTDMSYGSYIAGLAFFNAGVAGVHALAYPLGGQFQISHGESNAVLLPYVMSYIRSSCKEKMATIYEALGGDMSGMTIDEASVKCVEELEKLISDVGIPRTLKEFGIPEEAIEKLAVDGSKQKRLLERSPRRLEMDDIRKIFQAANEGEVVYVD
ncbi:iron-containing alcohol dehydrogenase [Oceanobacillus sp. CAU 1775]